MQGAAVDYARHAGRTQGKSVREIAGELGVCVVRLSGWMRGAKEEEGRGGEDDRGEEVELPAGGGAMSFCPDFNRMADAAAGDPLRDLLREEAGVLEREEREQLAKALEAGEVLDRGQRLALAVALRGSDLVGQMELVRGVLDFVAPPDKQVRTIWERVETEVTVPAGAVWEMVPLDRPLEVERTHYRTLASHLLVAHSEGKVLWVRLFASVRRTRVRWGKNELWSVVYLRPVERFARDHVLHQFALLASMVRVDGRNGKDWGKLFDMKSGKSITSYHRKKLVRKLQGEDGTAGVRGVRTKPDPRKGTKKI